MTRLISRMACSASVLLAVAGCAAAAAPASPGASTPAATMPTAAPTSSTASTDAITASPPSTTDGTGDEHFTGTWTFIGNEPTSVSGHDAVGLFTIDTSDPRATGDGTYDFGLRLIGNAGPTWGTMTLTNASGPWTGPCSGGNWTSGGETSVALSCWLSGTGDSMGESMYLQMLGGMDVPMRVDGVVYPGAVPAPEPMPSQAP